MNVPPKPERVLAISDRGVDLSIQVQFGGPQPNLYGVPMAARGPVRTEDFTGSVEEGGSCNVDALQLIPHCNGTHTECVGHITRERITLADTWSPCLLPALLVTVRDRHAISSADLRKACESWPDVPVALIVRTLSPGASAFRTYGVDGAPSPPFFTADAAAWMRATGIEHLLVDLPSLDPLTDGGAMVAHRAFWGLMPGSHDLEQVADGPDPKRQTITELIHIPGNLRDGPGILDLQIAPFALDAAPSRPVFFPHPPNP